MTVFESKEDKWLVLFLSLTSICCLYVAIVWILSWTVFLFVGALVLLTFSVVLPFWILLRTQYTVTDEDIEISCGPFNWSVSKSAIVSVSEIRSWGSAPALSIHRLKIDCIGGRSLVVSPQDKKGFISSLNLS